MRCHKHVNFPAVASCHNGCGRALCQHCAGQYDPPTCEFCAQHIITTQTADLQGEIVRLRRRLAWYWIVLACVPMVLLCAAVDIPAMGILFAVPMLIWSVGCFHQVLGSLLRATGFWVFQSFQAWGQTYLVGGLILLGLSPIILPIVIAIDTAQLRELSQQLPPNQP